MSIQTKTEAKAGTKAKSLILEAVLKQQLTCTFWASLISARCENLMCCARLPFLITMVKKSVRYVIGSNGCI